MPLQDSSEKLKQQVEELKSQIHILRSHYAAVVDNSLDAILLTVPDGRVIMANQAACRLFQMTESELIAGGRWAVVDDADPGVREAIEQRERTGQFVGQIKMRKNDGTIFPGLVSSSVFMDEQGRALTSTVIRDFSEHRRFEEFLQKYRNIVSSTPDGIAFLDTSYRYVIVNGAYEKFSGISMDGLIGRTVSDYLGEQVFSRIVKPYFDRCLQGEIINYQEWFDYPACGRRYVDITYFPFREGNDSISGVIANTRDITEHKKALDALKESRDRQKQIIENSNAGYFFIDLEGRFLQVNSAWLRMHGYDSAEEVIGRHFSITQEEELVQDAAGIVRRLLSGEEIAAGEYSRKCRDNTIAYHTFTANPVTEKGKIIGLEGFLIDISQRKKAEEALIRSEARFRSMFENMMNGFALHQVLINEAGEPVDYIFLEVNAAFEQLTGLKREEIIGKKVTQILQGIENEPADWIGRYGHVALGGGEVRFEQHSESLGKWFSVLAFCPRHGQFAVIFEDVTGRIQAEDALRKSEAKYRSMMESMTDPVYICSPDFKIQYMNAAMIERLGRNAVGEKCYRAIHDLDTECEWCLVEHTAENKSAETHIVSPRDKRNYRITSMPVQNADGSVSRMSILRDITEYVRAVEEKEKVKAQLQQSQKMESIGNLAGGIAHDFNNLLASIIGYTELALDEIEPGTQLEYCMQEVFTAGKRAKDLIKQILAFARQSEEDRGPIRVASIAAEVLGLIRATIPSTIEIKQKIASKSLIMGNASHVNQIFMNLCTNAAQAMEESGGTMDICVEDITIEKDLLPIPAGLSRGDYIRIKVSDTGSGIPPEIVDSIFEPYFSTKKPGAGTGLGLAVVLGIVESYGGKITAESKAGEGAVFVVYLPVSGQRDDLPSLESTRMPKGSERILLVDDEAPIVAMESQILKRLGYSVTARTSSHEAWEVFRSRPHDFDLVITDMTMPHMTGDKLAQEIMKLRPDIPIILCTGYSNRISEESAAGIGIKAFVYKPITKSDLAKTIRAVLVGNKGNQ